MTWFRLLTQAARRYIFSQQAVLTWVTLICVYVLIFHHQQVGRFFHDWKIRLWAGLFGSRLATPIDRSFQLPNDANSDKTKASWELRKGNIGLYAIQGRRQHMEDRFNVVDDLEHTGSGTSIYGIFDGHGGEFAAQFVEKTLFKTIMVRLLRSAVNGATKIDYGAILAEEIQYVDRQLLSVEKMTNEVSGTTALVALLKDNVLTVANVGDSRGVLCTEEGKTMPLSFDHKPQQVKERKRIKEAGGFVSFNGVWRVAGVLATSRALGDYPLKEKNYIIAEPDVFTFKFDEIKPKFMILATDGLWDAFSNEEAVAYVKDRLDEPHFGAKSIVLQAYYRGSLDNITVMVVNFAANATQTYSRQENTA